MSRIEFDEDAFAGTDISGENHRIFVPGRHHGGGTGPGRIMEDLPVFHYIGDAVLQLTEHVGAMIDAETVAST